MKSTLKTVMGVVGRIALILILPGIPLFLLYLFGSLGMFPLYVTRTIPVAGAALILALILVKYLGPRWKKRVWLTVLCVCIGCMVYIGAGVYRDSIPTIDDRDLLLWQYEPFAEDTKAVRLDEPASLQLDADAIRIDGATALYPVYAAFAQAVLPEGEYPVYEATKDGYGAVTCSNTVNAYERLIEGKTDVIFVAGPSQAQLDMAAAAGMELHLTPIGREAFVFFVNSKNPVTSLTVEQVQGIYTGEITNWAELGGKRQKIRPFQRAENSGSQTALQRLMDGLPLLEPEEEDRIAGMGGIIRQVANYRNYENAIGFSFRYYSTEMVQNGDIRLLALNGVEPTRETIQDGSYPISSEFYAITASPIGTPAPQETNETLAAFLNWVLSPQGQELIERTGYVGIH